MSKSNQKFLYYGHQSLDQTDLSWIKKALNSDWLTTGPFVENFEARIAKYVGAKYAVACSNGTAALFLAYLSLFGFNSKKRVLMPSMTFTATASAARIIGLDIDFVDCEKDTGLMDIDATKKQINRKKYDMIIPVHMNGNTANLEEIKKLAKKNGIKVVDDASHAIGSMYQTKAGKVFKVGSCKHTDATTFSFHAVKNITTGEGGAVVTNNKKLYEKLINFRTHGINREKKKFKNTKYAYSNKGILNPWYYEINEIGFNYRISDINCALGISQLKKIEKFKNKRNKIIRYYEYYLRTIRNKVNIVSSSKSKLVMWHLFVVKIDFDSLSICRSEFMNYLLKNKIQTQIHYIPLHLQPAYKTVAFSSLKGTMNYYKDIVSLPLYPSMSKNDVKYITSKIIKILK